jgi:pimeloyl-ACP methyl ester carboxylesterase
VSHFAITPTAEFNMSFTNRKLHVNSLDFNVRDIGSKQPALVFMHYWGGTGRTWDLVAKPLSERHRCVAPDLRGWGGSDRKAGSYDLHVQADDIAAIIQSLGLSQYILVGQSMGGKIAQILGSRRPAGLKALVLVAPAPPTPMAVPKEQRDAILDSYQSPGGVDIALSILTEKQLSPALRKQVADDTLGGAPAAKSAWTQEGMTLDISGLVGKINVPTTVIVGDADKVEHEDVLRRELATRISGTEFIILPGVGHFSIGSAERTGGCYHESDIEHTVRQAVDRGACAAVKLREFPCALTALWGSGRPPLGNGRE